MKQFLKKGKAKGTVLFTVISVMMVMVVFLMSTMVLTSSAHRRSYYSYFETQAQYAAQAALDAVTNSAYTDAGFYNWVKAETAAASPTNPPQVTVSFNNSDIPFTNGVQEVACTVERSPEKLLVWDDITQAVHEQTAYKITATASVGTGRNRSEYTVVNYIYENFRIEDPNLISQVDNSSANTIHRWSRRTTHDSDVEDEAGSISKAVYSLAAADTGNNMTYFGPQNSGMTLVPAGRINYDSVLDYDVLKVNDNYGVGDVFSVGNYKINGSYMANFTFEKFGESAQFYGNFVNLNAAKSNQQGVHFNAKISDDERASELSTFGAISYTRQPYVYVDGTLMSPVGGGIYIGMDESVKTNGGSRDYEFSNVNLFCGGVKTYGDAGTEMVVAGDAYLYDPDVDSDWDGVQGLTSLTHFASDNINRANTQWSDFAVGGNLICNNRSLKLNANAKGMTIQGDLIMTNPSGELIIANPITVTGKVLCAGTLTEENRNKINCATIVTSSYAMVDGIEKNTGSYNEGEDVYVKENDEGTLYFDYYDYLYSNYGDGAYYNYVNESGYDSRDDAYAAYMANSSSQLLMPYSLRLDEIFDEYLRWDLKSTDINVAAQNAANDPMIQESIAAGHAWQDSSGAYQMKAFAGDQVPVYSNEVWGTRDVEYYDGEAMAHQGDPGANYQQGWFENCADGNNHWAICVVPEDYLISRDVTWVDGAVVYVPYTTSISNNDFIKHFEPLTNSSSVQSLIGPEYYIDDITEFTQGMTGAPTYSVSGGGTRANVVVAYHKNDQAYATEAAAVGRDKVLNNALIIKDNCYLDVSNMNGGYVFIDPSANSHDNSDPLRVVIRGSSNTGGTIVINNTATYSSDYQNFVTYASRVEAGNPDSFAPRRQVYLFFEGGFAGNTSPGFNIVMSGAYSQFYDRVFDVVSNPIYPNSDLWAGLDYRIKYAYELVPNTLLFGQNGYQYALNNGGCLNAEIIMPTSTFNASNASNYKAEVHYQEEYYSSIYSSVATAQGPQLPLFGIGSVMSDGITTGSNTAAMVYIGDAHRGGVIESTTLEDSTDATATQKSEKLGSDNTEYFNNDHLGAS